MQNTSVNTRHDLYVCKHTTFPHAITLTPLQYLNSYAVNWKFRKNFSLLYGLIWFTLPQEQLIFGIRFSG